MSAEVPRDMTTQTLRRYRKDLHDAGRINDKGWPIG